MDFFIIWLLVGVICDTVTMYILCRYWKVTFLEMCKETPWWAHIMLIIGSIFTCVLAISTHMGNEGE